MDGTSYPLTNVAARRISMGKTKQYNVRWYGSSLISRGNVSLSAITDYSAIQQADKLTVQLGLGNCSREVSNVSGVIHRKPHG